MPRDQRFDILFEPQKIGPVTAPNRFYQVPHCTGMGYRLPQMLAHLRRTKAEGGWGVVNTEYCSIHPTSDDMPYPHASLWDDGDVRNLARIAADIHAHGALAGVELWHGGLRSSNLHTREPAIGPVSYPAFGEPWQCRAMEADDIKALRAWHRAAARRSATAGFDIVYVYAAHTYLLAQFLDPLVNQRRDAYGGSAENRWRLVREIVEDTREAVAGKAAVALRIEVVDEDGDGEAERTEMLASLAPMVDLYDVTVPDYSHEMGTSRFIREGSLADKIRHVRQATAKPVVSVGRFTTPETMLAMVKGGVVDFIGAARPSIADPFLPQKIRDDRQDDIRECIGCNICYASDSRGVPIRCTQNPTMGEEWRRGWHPESVPPARRPARALIVGSGPAGLEAAHILGKRGVEVVLAEAEEELGGRVRRESRLPGFSEWMRVADYRINQLAKLGGVTVYRASRMTAGDVVDTGIAHVFVATGSRWRTDGRGRLRRTPVPSFADERVIGVDAILDGARPEGPIVVADDDNFYMASAIAEALAGAGREVAYVASDSLVASWAVHTYDQARIHAALDRLGITIVLNHRVTELMDGAAVLTCMFTGRTREIACRTLVPVTSREPEASLWHALRAQHGARFETLIRIGDCAAPGLIAHAVHDGHRAAREFDMEAGDGVARRDRVVL